MRPHSLRLTLLVLLFLLPALVRAQKPTSGEPPASAAAPTTGGLWRNYPVHGMIGLDYLYRGVETGYQDSDLYTNLSLDTGTAGVSRISGHLFARVSWDLDGEQEDDKFNYFRDVVDYYEEPVNFRLYSGYVDFNRLGPVKLIRLGRQEMWDAPIFMLFDGGRVETMEAKQVLNFKLGAYGGVAVRHLYESATVGDEFLYGAYAQTRPWQGARASVNYTHLEDENYYGKLKDDYLSVSLRQSINDQFLVEGFYSRVEDTDRDLRGRILFFIPQTETQIQVTYYELLEPQEALTLELDYYYWVMEELLPYRQLGVLAYQGITKYVAIQGGYDTRTLSEDPEDGFQQAFNHEYQHYFGTLILRPAEGIAISGTGENWKTTDDDSIDITTAAGDVTWRLDTRFRLSAGTYYSLYQYDIMLEEEKDEVRTYYVKVRWAPVKSVRLDLAYQYEETEYEDFNTVRAGLNFIF